MTDALVLVGLDHDDLGVPPRGLGTMTSVAGRSRSMSNWMRRTCSHGDVEHNAVRFPDSEEIVGHDEGVAVGARLCTDILRADYPQRRLLRHEISGLSRVKATQRGRDSSIPCTGLVERAWPVS